MHADLISAAELRRARARRVHGLYAVTPQTRDTDALVAKVAAALDGGAATVQYRCKDLEPDVRDAQARALARVLAARGGVYIVNDEPLLAKAVGADGVHLGVDDVSVAAAREILGPERLVGVSCYDDFARAQRAVEEGADYVAFGSFFASSTKPEARRADPSLLSRARSLGVPVVAIGGITRDNARMLVDAGADAVAVISDVFDHADTEDVRLSADALARCFARTQFA